MRGHARGDGMKTYYKFTKADGSPCNGGSGRWSLPRGKRPGAWWKIDGDIRPCSNGLHLCRAQDLTAWMNEALWEVEVHANSEIIVANEKVVVRQARLLRRIDTWNDRTARLFAVHCAARVLPIFKKAAPKDRCVRDCLIVAHKFAMGTATQADLDAARDAAGAARDAVAGAAAGAARDAAGVNAWNATMVGAKKWQRALLLRALKKPHLLERMPKELA